MGKKTNSVGGWKCIVGPHGYDPAKEDSDDGIAAGTAFKDLPNDRVCPECGTGEAMAQEAKE